MKETILTDNILDKDFFPDESSKKFFIERLKINDSIVPYFEDRKTFDDRKGNFFVPTGEINDTKKPQAYDLFLPNDLKYHEIYTLLHTIDQKIGKNKFTSVASIATVTKTFLAGMLRSGKITEPEIEGFIKKHNIPSTVVEYIKNAPIKINSQTITAVKKVKSGNREEQNKYIQDTLETGTSKLFFERGKQTLFDYMKVFTQADYDKIHKEKKDDIKERNVVLMKEKEEYDTIESSLRDKIGITQYQQELEQLRKEGDVEKLADKEYEVAEKILQEIYKYPRDDSQASEYQNNVSPRHILETKEMRCVGKSILGHVFLSSLGIKHQGAQLPAHSALVIKCSNKKDYYFDPTNKEHLKEIQRSKGVKEENGIYIYLPGLYSSKKDDNRLCVGDPENILMSQMYHNKGIALDEIKQHEEAIKCYDKVIELFPKRLNAYYNKGSALNEIKQYEEAIKCYDKVIELDPNAIDAYALKGLIYYELNQDEEGHKCYEKIIELEPDIFTRINKKLTEYKLYIATLKDKLSNLWKKFTVYFK